MEYCDKIKNISEQKQNTPHLLIEWSNFGYEKIDDRNFTESSHSMIKLQKDGRFFVGKFKELMSGENKFNKEKSINNILIEELQNNKIEDENIVVPKAIEVIQSNGVDGIIYEYFNDSMEKYNLSNEDKILKLLYVDKFIKSIPISERLNFLPQRTIKEYQENLDKIITVKNDKIRSMAIELRGLLSVDYFEPFDKVLNHGDLDMSNIGYNSQTKKIAIFDFEGLCVGNNINALAHCSYQSVLYKIYNRLLEKDRSELKKWDIIAGENFYKIIEGKIVQIESLKQFYGINMFYSLVECFDGLLTEENEKIVEIELEENINFFYDNLEKFNGII